MNASLKAALVILCAIFWVACSDSSRCSEPCSTLYGAEEDQCYLQRPGQSSTDLFEYCKAECMEALAMPGEVGSYYPYEKEHSAASIDLKNSAQAELWMQCISETDCERLNNGYCAPVW
ncbi:MAG: hypothetical protein VX519_02960 [Myxococcota bacterium]|nr:hypothetical protein [Myxococcota bacterium]